MTTDTSVDVREVIFVNQRCEKDYLLLPRDVCETADGYLDALQNNRVRPCNGMRPSATIVLWPGYAKSNCLTTAMRFVFTCGWAANKQFGYSMQGQKNHLRERTYRSGKKIDWLNACGLPETKAIASRTTSAPLTRYEKRGDDSLNGVTAMVDQPAAFEGGPNWRDDPLENTPIVRRKNGFLKSRGYQNVEISRVKFCLVERIREAVESKKWKQVEVAQHVNSFDKGELIDQPDVSRILNGNVDRFSVERLLVILAALDNRVSVRSEPVEAGKGCVVMSNTD